MRWKGGRVKRWQGGKRGRLMKQEGGKHLLLFKGGRRWISPRFHLFVSDVNQRDGMGSRFSCAAAGIERLS